MSRALSVLLVVCCVLSMGVTGLPAPDSPSIGEANPSQSDTCEVDDPNVACVANTTNHLTPNGSTVTVAASTLSISASSAVARDVDQTTTRLTIASLRAAYENASGSARETVVTRYGNALENRTAELRLRERTALRSYNDDRISTDESLRTLAALDSRADQLWRLSKELDELWRRATNQYNRFPYAEVRADLYGLRSPIRDRLQRVYAGEAPTLRVHITTTESSIALAAFVENNGQVQFLRDTYLGAVRGMAPNNDTYNGYPSPALDRIEEVYPWAFTSQYLAEVTDTGGNAGVYHSTSHHAYGTTTVFLDGASEQVFAEHQRLILNRIPHVTTATSNESTGLNVTLDITIQGGPLTVTVTDATGTPLNAIVTLNGRAIGPTGDDGSLRTVAPYSSSITVRADVDGNTVVITRFPY